eukprot:708168-Prorocentrum_minimum.AAC.1
MEVEGLFGRRLRGSLHCACSTAKGSVPPTVEPSLPKDIRFDHFVPCRGDEPGRHFQPFGRGGAFSRLHGSGAPHRLTGTPPIESPPPYSHLLPLPPSHPYAPLTSLLRHPDATLTPLLRHPEATLTSP